MIDVAEVNRRLVDQDATLRSSLEGAAAHVSDPDLRVIADLLAGGIAAMHERQGNAILLMLQAAR